MLLLRVLLSAVTLFGGHVLNRRLDRILQVFAMLALLGIVYFAAPSLLFSASRTDLVPDAFSLAALLVAIIAVVSAAWTWKDVKAPAPAPWPLGARFAGVIVSLFGLLLIAFATMFLLAWSSHRSVLRTVERSSTPPSFVNTMYAAANLGGNVRYTELRKPPSGDHPLRGRIVMAGKPAVAAKVELILNETFRTEWLTTDARGEFEILLPAGPWTLNQVTVLRWRDAPEDESLLLFSGYEPRKQSGYYSRTLFDESRVRIELPATAAAKLPTFELRESVAIQWPAASSSIGENPDEGPAAADPMTATIQWSAVPGATEYEIQLHTVEREDRSMRTSTVLLRRQSGTALRLADLPKQPRESAEPTEYSVMVYAFDAEGNLLSQNREGFNHHAFLLDGQTRLAKEKVTSSPTQPANVTYMENVRHLSVVHSLLDYEQLDAARAILARVTDDAPPGRKAAMQGAIEALAGNCAAAIPLLDQADREGGLGCAPLKYREMCSSAR